MELLTYLVLLVAGIVLLVKGFKKKDFYIFPNKEFTPEVTSATYISDEDIVYDYDLMEDEKCSYCIWVQIKI